MATRRSNPKHVGRHEWNAYEDYKRVNERKLADYPFIEDIELTFVEIGHGGQLFIRMDAILRLPQGVVLEVTKFLETQRRGAGRGRGYTFAAFRIATTPGLKGVTIYCGMTTVMIWTSTTATAGTRIPGRSLSTGLCRGTTSRCSQRYLTSLMPPWGSRLLASRSAIGGFSCCNRPALPLTGRLFRE